MVSAAGYVRHAALARTFRVLPRPCLIALLFGWPSCIPALIESPRRTFNRRCCGALVALPDQGWFPGRGPRP